ncbi:MAG: alkene reductase [Sandaracinobacteroides sp.]
MPGEPGAARLDALFSPVTLGSLELPNRIVMAPMTRLRAPDGAATAIMADYYRQRAGAGLIVTECTMVSDTSAAYIAAPGIYHDRFIDGWRLTTEAVHEAGGRIFLQLWHSGRVAHVSLMPGGQPPLAPSAIAGTGELHTPAGRQPMSAPRALAAEEIRGLTKAFGKAAGRARQAGFDGVEIHGAFGYLLDQFLRNGSNRRDDRFGGSPENRSRFLMAVVAEAQQVFGKNVGVKLSPSSSAHGMADSDPEGLFAHVLAQLTEADLAYVHMMEPLPEDLAIAPAIAGTVHFARPRYAGTLIANGGFDGDSANAAIAAGIADLVSFGRPFIANPDLPARLQAGAVLAEPRRDLVYGQPGRNPGDGYSDYPRMAP